LAAAPSASINAARKAGPTLAAYRFFSNPNVQLTKFASHRAATERRIREHAVVLMVQDTTEYDFSAHPPIDGNARNAGAVRLLRSHASGRDGPTSSA